MVCLDSVSDVFCLFCSLLGGMIPKDCRMPGPVFLVIVVEIVVSISSAQKGDYVPVVKVPSYIHPLVLNAPHK